MAGINYHSWLSGQREEEQNLERLAIEGVAGSLPHRSPGLPWRNIVNPQWPSRKGAEGTMPTVLSSYLQITYWCFPLAKSNYKPDGKEYIEVVPVWGFLHPKQGWRKWGSWGATGAMQHIDVGLSFLLHLVTLKPLNFSWRDNWCLKKSTKSLL